MNEDNAARACQSVGRQARHFHFPLLPLYTCAAMYLKRLELRGFKTFAAYTDFVFDAGITAIVGPNGSGKSNIADAVRWVLGEQSYSALRGKRTEDMIFAGTSRRSQLGMAEAIMTLDNSSHWLPLDFDEVTIARRAYRSGENQYLINGSRVRLRDVLDLLGKASLGRQGFVVVGQGLVDAALSLRPEERRVLFEEAAGIRIYQEKRSDALEKLAETQQNIVRLNDILTEIAPRMHELERQAKRAQERQVLEQDLEKLLRLWYGYHWQRLQVRLSEAEATLRRRQEELNLSRARLHEVEALIASTASRQTDLRRRLSLLHKASSDLHRHAETHGRELAIARERLSLLRARQMDLRTGAAQLDAKQVQLQQNILSTHQEFLRMQEEVHAHTSRLQQLGAERQAAGTARLELERHVEEAREAAFRSATAVADIRNRLTSLHERRRQLLAEREKSAQDLATVLEEVTALQHQIERVTGQRDQYVALREAARLRHQQLEQESASFDAELGRIREALAAAAREKERLQDRFETVQELRRSMAGLAPGVRAVLQSREKLPGIVGPVSELVVVPQQLERAIEAALGSYAQALVVETWDDAQAAISELHHTRSGWATFLPLDSLDPPDAIAAPLVRGVLGLAQTLVQYEPRHEVVFRLLLGRVVVVEDLDTARQVRAHLSHGQRIVTLSGEVVQTTGIVSGGSGKSHGGLFAQEREWRELPARLEELHKQLRAHQAALDTVTQTRKALLEKLETTSAEMSELARRIEEAGQTLGNLERKADRLRGESEWQRTFAERQQRELSALDEQAAILRQQLAESDRERSAADDVMRCLLAKLEEARRQEEEVRQRAASAEMALALATRQLDTCNHLLGSQKADLEQVVKELETNAQQSATLDQEANGLASRIETLQETSARLSKQIADLTGEIVPAEAELETLETQSAALERELARARQRVTELDALYAQQVLEKERNRDAVESLERRIQEDLGDIEYPSERVRQLRLEFLADDRQVLAVPDTLPESLATEIKELKSRLRRMGPINPAAPEEYRRVSERYRFLESQVADLQRSASTLQQIIKELDEVMKTEFLSVFDTVATEFSRYFELLFCGGQARLALTDPQSPATTGVEILARPPGKRQQSLALLSGGERALTATALLLAVLKARPLPFCILDEVDAMLDEANVGRFKSLLEEFSKQTQFIVITHNRQTIEAANTIYGVSMGEDGVSKVISLQLAETQEAQSVGNRVASK